MHNKLTNTLVRKRAVNAVQDEDRESSLTHSISQGLRGRKEAQADEDGLQLVA
jgi:hypothetical protein